MNRLKQYKKELLCKYVDYKCEQCKKIFKVEKLEVHRIRRGNQNGTYEHRNCKILCKKCHQLYHTNEFNNCQGK